MITMVDVPVLHQTIDFAPALYTLAALFPTHPIYPIVVLNSENEPRYVCCQGYDLGI